MKDLILYLTKYIVRKPERIFVEENTLENGDVQIDLFVDEDDLGRVIGKRGKNAKNLRNIVNAVSLKKGKNYSLKISGIEDVSASR